MRFENRTFTNEDVTLDYNEFFDCTFGDGARLHFGGGQYQMLTCRMAGEISFGFHDNAHRTLIWLKFIRSLPNGLEILESILAAIPATPPPMTLN